MSSENDEYQATSPEEITFILAIAGRVDAQSRIFAKKLHADRSVYYAYAGYDSLSSASSIFRYGVNLVFPFSDADFLHDLMLSPAGIAIIVVETVFLVSYSVLATHFEFEQEGIKHWIAISWPYFRDILKGLKNALTGWTSTVLALHLIGGMDIQYLIVPIGLVLGILAAANRIWLRSMLDERKLMMSTNTKLLLEIKNRNQLTYTERQHYLEKIAYQTLYKRRRAYVSVTAGGFIDSLYLFMGVLNVAVLAPPLLISIAIICCAYTLGCMVTRLYEEYDYQRKLILTQIQCRQALIAKELETLFCKLVHLEEKVYQTSKDREKINRLRGELCFLIDCFDIEHNRYQKKARNSYLSAFLVGMKNGLYGYTALTSILFLISTILLMAGVSFPPALLLSFVLFSVLLIIGLSIFSIVETYRHNKKLDTVTSQDYDLLAEIRTTLSQSGYIYSNKEVFQRALNEGLNLAPLPQSFFQDWSECVRSFFAGLGKGMRFAGFAGNFLKVMNEQGHYVDTPLLYVLKACAGILFSVVLFLRAWAKGFGRLPLGYVEEPDTSCASNQEIEMQDMSAGVFFSDVTPPPRPASALASYGLFSQSQVDKSALHRTHSEPDLSHNHSYMVASV